MTEHITIGEASRGMAEGTAMPRGGMSSRPLS